MKQQYALLLARLKATFYGVGKCGLNEKGEVVRITKNLYSGVFFVGTITTLPKNCTDLAEAANYFNSLVTEPYKIIGIQAERSRSVINPQPDSEDNNSLAFIEDTLSDMIRMYLSVREAMETGQINLQTALSMFGDFAELFQNLDNWQSAYEQLQNLNISDQHIIETNIQQITSEHLPPEYSVGITAAYRFMSGAIQLVSVMGGFIVSIGK